MTIEDYIDGFRRSIDYVKDNAQSIVVEIFVLSAFSALGLIMYRIQNYGIKADGTSLGEYSTKPMFVSPRLEDWQMGSITTTRRFLKGRIDISNKSKSAKDKRKKETWRNIGGVSLFLLEEGYKEKREAADLRVDIVDLTARSGKTGGEGLWDNINVSVNQIDVGYEVLIEVAETHIDQFNGLVEKYDNFLMLSEIETKAGESETGLLTKAMASALLDIFRGNNIEMIIVNN